MQAHLFWSILLIPMNGIFCTKKNGESVAIYLPVILYSKENGIDIFSSKKLAHGNIYKGYKLEEEGELKG